MKIVEEEMELKVRCYLCKNFIKVFESKTVVIHKENETRTYFCRESCWRLWRQWLKRQKRAE